jgi:Flp pilus assembly protein TadD
MKLVLFVSSSFLTLLLIVHSVKARGWKTTLYFFLASFLFGVVRGNSVALVGSGENSGPYIFSEAIIRIGWAELPACVGWVFALYLSWTLAEGVLARRPDLLRAVLPLSAFAISAMACFSDAVETTASGVGWWRWNIVNQNTPLFPGGTHLFGIVEWMSVGLDFLVPFLLFRTREGARSPLAWAAVLLYPLHWVTHWKYVTAPGFPHAYEIYHALIVFTIPIFILLKKPLFAPEPPRQVSRFVSLIPALAIAGMFGVLLVMDLGVLKSPELLISLFPLTVFMMGQQGREKRMLAAGSVGALLAFGISLASGQDWIVSTFRAVPPLLPPALMLVSVRLAQAGLSAGVRRAYVAGVVLAMIAGGAEMVKGKRIREEYSALMYQGKALLDAKDYPGAEAVFLKAVALAPNVNLGTKSLANAYGGQGKMEQAWDYARRSVELNPSDFEAYQLAGNVLLSQEQSERAIPYYERAMMLNPGDAESARALAQCYAQQKRYADAIAALKKARARHPEDPELGHLLGALLVQTGDYREARRVVEGLLRVAPQDSGAHLLMAFIRAAGGDTAGARAEAERVLQLDPTDSQARGLLESLPK